MLRSIPFHSLNWILLSHENMWYKCFLSEIENWKWIAFSFGVLQILGNLTKRKKGLNQNKLFNVINRMDNICSSLAQRIFILYQGRTRSSYEPWKLTSQSNDLCGPDDRLQLHLLSLLKLWFCQTIPYVYNGTRRRQECTGIILIVIVLLTGTKSHPQA